MDGYLPMIITFEICFRSVMCSLAIYWLTSDWSGVSKTKTWQIVAHLWYSKLDQKGMETSIKKHAVCHQSKNRFQLIIMGHRDKLPYIIFSWCASLP